MLKISVKPYYLLTLLLISYVSHAQSITIGAKRIQEYLPLLQGKKVAVVVNQTSTIGKTHLVDTLVSQGVIISTLFAPEHGFRGKADAGEHVKNQVDQKTGLPITSLYGKNKKPSIEQLEGIDIVIFDIQDVGCRFYTYISTMHYVMEACAENNIPMLIFDRPNPNGHYVDGPILAPEYSSFVGMHPIPIVHGLTIGELAMMINQEGWLIDSLKCNLTVIKMEDYSHSYTYSLPIKPSPNLPNDLSIQLYPSLCLFEGTDISVGRGTNYPFQVIGYPNKKYGDFSFTPKSIEGMSKYPKHQDKVCYGVDFRDGEGFKFTLSHLIKYYSLYEDKENFFNPFFDKLVGNGVLKDQIKGGMSEKEITETWQPALKQYKALRKKYLLYEDFEP